MDGKLSVIQLLAAKGILKILLSLLSPQARWAVTADLKAPTVSCSLTLAGRSFQSMSVLDTKLY